MRGDAEDHRGLLRRGPRPSGGGGQGGGLVGAPTSEEVVTLESYPTAIPEAARQSLNRPGDLSGKTVPPAFQLASAEDVGKILPARPPRFRAGMELSGKPGRVLDRLLGIGGFGEVWFA